MVEDFTANDRALEADRALVMKVIHSNSNFEVLDADIDKMTSASLREFLRFVIEIRKSADACATINHEMAPLMGMIEETTKSSDRATEESNASGEKDESEETEECEYATEENEKCKSEDGFSTITHEKNDNNHVEIEWFS